MIQDFKYLHPDMIPRTLQRDLKTMVKIEAFIPEGGTKLLIYRLSNPGIWIYDRFATWFVTISRQALRQDAPLKTGFSRKLLEDVIRSSRMQDFKKFDLHKKGTNFLGRTIKLYKKVRYFGPGKGASS